jgi:hypothetical protein
MSKPQQEFLIIECDDEFCPQNRWTGRSITVRAGFIFKQGVGVDLGTHVVISLLPARA